MGRKLTVVVAMVVLVGGGGGCREARHGSEKARVPYYQPLATKPDARVIAGQSRFAWKLLRALQSQQPDRNLFFSPASLNLALAMVVNGARGETLAGIARTLELQGLTVPEINAGCQALMDSLKAREGEPEVIIANSLWADTRYPLVPDFVTSMAGSYGATLRNVSFASPSAAAGDINRWADEQTRGLVPEIVTPQDLDRAAVLVLANALCFDGRWTTPFQRPLTQDEPFTRSDGRQVQMPTMVQEGQYRYLEDASCQAISLPYGSGRLSFEVVLPAKGTAIADLCRTITPERWGAWQDAFAVRDGQLKLPRFRAEYAGKLKGALTTLGMGAAFAEGPADFSAMLPPGVWVGDVLHRAVIEVQEEGTRAAAVTAVAMEAGVAVPRVQTGFRMVVDRPFLCAIRDNGTGAIIFLGVVVDPEALARR